MNIHWIPLLIAFAVHAAIDVALYRDIKRAKVLPHWVAPCFKVSALLLYAVLAGAIVCAFHPSDLSFRIATYLFLLFCGIQGPKLPAWLIYWPSRRKKAGQRTRKALIATALATFATLVGVVAWSTFVTPYTIEVHRVVIESPNLPAAFNGYRIVQFSDAHVGTYGTDTSFVSQYVDTINAQHPDLICFTGDMVNRHSAEVDPFVTVLSRLHAPDGVVAIQGNHDYKDYYPWRSHRHWQSDSLRLIRQEQAMGFTVCPDSSFAIRRQADSIVVVGLTCFRPPHSRIPQNLRKVYPHIEDPNIYKIVLQHVPEVWTNYTDSAQVDLMLAGHTHAMQVAVPLFGTTISPARLLSRFWGGLYKNGNASLYVNTGVGEVGMPMRIGAKPEITVITLKTKHPSSHQFCYGR